MYMQAKNLTRDQSLSVMYKSKETGYPQLYSNNFITNETVLIHVA